ncbi:MAG: flagellar filament capping protein FliD [Gammaproteobacteria bacterium]|nr:flagellar cap protein [Gammaproteobacteria bacterium]
MATFQSLGVGSGLDLTALVSQLVAAERAPKQRQITTQQSRVAVELSAVGTFKGALSAFHGAVSALKLPTSFDVFAARSSNEEIFTVSANHAATLGTYDIEVVSVATAEQISSRAFESGDAVVGTGSLTISVGGQSFTVQIDDGSGTLRGIRDAINRAEDNTGVRATIVNGTDGSHLVLTSTKTGLANRITIAVDGEGLEALAYSADAPNEYTQVRAAQDALVYVAGTEHRSASNTIADAIEGVTLQLLKADAGNTHSIKVERNVDALVGRIDAFVTQFNSLAGTMASLQSYDPTTKQAGALLGDPLVRGIESALRRELGRPIDGANAPYNTLSSIGITMTVDGKLELDKAKLRKALESDLAAVQRIFSAESGIAVRLDNVLAPHLAPDGSLALRNQTLNDRTKKLDADLAALDARMQVIEERYIKQFTALDTLLAQLQSTSAYLGQQLANLPKPKA